jgi:DNA primase
LDIIAIIHRVDHNFWYTPAGFPKENFLYNYHRVKGKYKTAILVEGETDVMNSCKNNFWNVVAQSGGELSDEQAKLLSVFDCVYFALDNDSAGTRYTECAYEKMKPDGTEIKVMLYDAADPGSCEKEKWMLAYEEAVSFAEYRFGMSMEFQQDYDKYIKKSRR